MLVTYTLPLFTSGSVILGCPPPATLKEKSYTVCNGLQHKHSLPPFLPCSVLKLNKWHVNGARHLLTNLVTNEEVGSPLRETS